ncbi:hypothetical protein V6N12_024723 [Hibiscus sabdariffa]|uniref:Uncharacterized protein n=1 Tax=Hibiscus sabdariffa TaxID=183260 RepID=A0ABR2BFX2_9ROSI
MGANALDGHATIKCSEFHGIVRLGFDFGVWLWLRSMAALRGTAQLVVAEGVETTAAKSSDDGGAERWLGLRDRIRVPRIV